MLFCMIVDVFMLGCIIVEINYDGFFWFCKIINMWCMWSISVAYYIIDFTDFMWLLMLWWFEFYVRIAEDVLSASFWIAWLTYMELRIHYCSMEWKKIRNCTFASYNLMYLMMLPLIWGIIHLSNVIIIGFLFELCIKFQNFDKSFDLFNFNVVLFLVSMVEFNNFFNFFFFWYFVNLLYIW